MKKLLYLLIGAGILFTAACKKDSNSAATATQPNTTPQINDAFGVLVAIKTNNYINMPFVGVINMPLGTAVAAFPDAIGSSTYVDAGSITADDSTLVKQSNNSYFFTPSTGNATGLDFGSGNVDWSVTGNSATGVPAINKTTSMGFPTVDSITNGSTVSISSALTLSAASPIINADSVLFFVAGPSGTLIKTVAGNVSSVTFSATEMGTVGTGTGFLEIVPYNWEKQTISGKNYYFVNEAASTKMVEFE